MNHRMLQSLNKEGSIIRLYHDHTVWQQVHLLFPPQIVQKLAHFIIRNTLSITLSSSGEARYHCCKRCLKAHLVVAARKYNLSKEALFSLDKLFPEKVGHDGYYLNEGNLLKT